MMSERKNIYADRTFYQKSGEKSYLVICSGDEPDLPYQINMIRYNDIAGLLPVQFFIEDGEYRYFYDISCMESLYERMKQKKYSIKEIRTVMSDLYRCVLQMEEYLLDTDCLILEPEYLFTAKDRFNIQFCFYQDKKETFEKSLEKLFDYFLNQLDYQDEKTVVLVYSLYQKSREEHVPLYELMKQFCEIPVIEKKTKYSEINYEAAGAECIKEDESEPKADEKEKKRMPEEVLKWESKKSISGVSVEMKKMNLKKFMPYVPDLIGGYGIARILWFISKNHAQMSGKTFMFWMFMIAGILIGCGILSAFLSGSLNKCAENQEEQQQKEYLKNQSKEKYLKEQQGQIYNKETDTSGLQKEKYAAKSKSDDRCSTVKRDFQEPFKKVKKLNSEEEDLFEEFTFEDPEEQEKMVRVDSIPATVVMSEPELFQAFNPVLVSKNKGKFQDIVLKDRVMVLGKVRGIADICLEGKSISRVHARIIRDQNGCSVTDLGSTNGTFVNGMRLAERQMRYLQHGDEVRFAEAVFEFQTEKTEIPRSQQISDVI